MTYEVVVLASAGREFREIIDYLARILASPRAARELVEDFEQTIDMLRSNPELFALSRLPELAAKGYRSFPVKNYLVIYTLRKKTVYISHIVHQTQDYARLI